MRDSHADLVALRESGAEENGRATIARVAIVNEVTRLLAHLLLLLSGILIASTQFSASPPPVSLYVRSTIIFTIAILVFHTLLLRWLRHKLTDEEVSPQTSGD